MSLIFFPMSIGFMSHVDFKKRQCRPVEFRGQGPLSTYLEADLSWCPAVHTPNMDVVGHVILRIK